MKKSTAATPSDSDPVYSNVGNGPSSCTAVPAGVNTVLFAAPAGDYAYSYSMYNDSSCQYMMGSFDVNQCQTWLKEPRKFYRVSFR